MDVPVAFISSTEKDLKIYRARVKEAALQAGLYPRMMEYFDAVGARKPLAECLAQISGGKDPSNLLIAIVAHRYGWIPEDQQAVDGQPGSRSITWLECKEAADNGQDVLAFLVDPEKDWPYQHRDASLIESGELEASEVQRRIRLLKDFKQWLGGTVVTKTFRDPDDLYNKVLSALLKWRQEHEGQTAVKSAPGRPVPWLQWLVKETSHIDIRGLAVESGEAKRFPIDDLYIRLTGSFTLDRDPLDAGIGAAEHGNRRKTVDPARFETDRRGDLAAALKNNRLLVVGDPGAGKTTFLRWVAYRTACARLENDAKAVQKLFGVDGEMSFPLFIRLSDLFEHRASARGGDKAPKLDKSPRWLAHYLAEQAADLDFSLDEQFFQDQLTRGPSLLLLDGLDEAPNEAERESMCALIEQAARRFENCRIVVTTRPAALRGQVALPGFANASIDALADDAIELFLTRWCEALFPDNPEGAERHLRELLEPLRQRREIRRLARTPMMLTALAVVHWHEKRLPEQRAELYESILNWLARARKREKGRPGPNQCLVLLQKLALAMHCHPEGRQVQVSRRWAAEAIADHWAEGTEGIRLAEEFLTREELDSGIVVQRGSDVRFWHLTFQEYLTAKAVAALTEKPQQELLLKQSKLHQPEWREAVLLLGGVLHGQGKEKVDGLISAALDALGTRASLEEQARFVGVFGAMMGDLSPTGFSPSDRRYEQVFEKVLGIFDREKSKSVAVADRIAAAEALGQAGDPRLTPAQCRRNWVELPGGSFPMGGERRVRLSPFKIGRYPVTVAEYQRFVEDGGYDDPEYWEAGGFGKWEEPGSWEEQLGHPNRPVTEVSWFEAAAFAKWAGARLPTEAEWEFAARGKEGRIFAWGNENASPERMNYGESNVGAPTPVGVYPLGATPESVCDLSGNVWEWCWDWRGKYQDREAQNPTGPEKGTGRVLRGGAWNNYGNICRGSIRYGNLPVARNYLVGFRLVLGVAARTESENL